MICKHSVLDETYPGISFDVNGISNIYKQSKKNYELIHDKFSKANNSFLEKSLTDIKRSKGSGDYNCILGLSGGLDSSYMLHKAVNDYGLKPLVFHVDAGWNSEISVSNIEKLVDKLNLDLFTEVINWNDVKNLQVAFFKSGVPHIDIPQDHAFVSVLYNYAEKYKIKYILNGGNIYNEIVPMPYLYYYWGTDLKHIKDIIKKFSQTKIKNYPFSSIFRHKLYLRYIKRLKVIKLLNFEYYNQQEAINLLRNTYDWKPYGQKHFESNFTRFYEGYWLPKRFNFDVRKCQLSSLIISGQITKNIAMSILEKSPLRLIDEKNDYNYILSKLGITNDEMNKYLFAKHKYYYDYKNTNMILKPIENFLNMTKLAIRGGAF